MKYDVLNSEDPKAYRRAQTAASRANNPVQYLLNQAKYRAKKEGLEFSITLDELVIPDICPIFGIPLFFTPGRRSDNSFSLDRKDNSKGYTKDNTRVISWKGNQYKGDMSIEEVKSLLKYMEGISH